MESFSDRQDQCWTTCCRLKLVLQILQGELSFEQASSLHNIEVSEIKGWMLNAKPIIDATQAHYSESLIGIYDEYIESLQCAYIDAVQKKDAFIRRQYCEQYKGSS